MYANKKNKTSLINPLFLTKTNIQETCRKAWKDWMQTAENEEETSISKNYFVRKNAKIRAHEARAITQQLMELADNIPRENQKQGPLSRNLKTALRFFRGNLRYQHRRPSKLTPFKISLGTYGPKVGGGPKTRGETVFGALCIYQDGSAMVTTTTNPNIGYND